MSRLISRAALLTAIAAVTFAGSSASAKEYSRTYSNRSLTLSRGMHNSIAEFTLDGGLADESFGIRLQGDQGVTDNLTVGAGVPLAFTPDFNFGDLDLHGTFLLVRGPVDIGAFAQLTLPTDTNSQLRVGIPVRLFVGKFIKLDVSGILHVDFRSDLSGGTTSSLEVPVEFALNLGSSLYGAAKSGVILFDFDPDVLSIPLGLEGGYSLAGPGGGAFIDVYGGINLPALINTNDAIKSFDEWTIYAGGRLFFDFF